MECFSELWYTFKASINENEVDYQTGGIAFEVALEYNLYKRKFDAMYY